MAAGKPEDAASEQSGAAVPARIRALEFAMEAAQGSSGRQNIQAQAVCQEAQRFLAFITATETNNEG